jgi:hypothetical protein
MDRNWPHGLASLSANRGVKITQNMSKNWATWFFVTNVLMKSMGNAWEKQGCLNVTVKFARNSIHAKMPKTIVLFELLI